MTDEITLTDEEVADKVTDEVTDEEVADEVTDEVTDEEVADEDEHPL